MWPPRLGRVNSRGSVRRNVEPRIASFANALLPPVSNSNAGGNVGIIAITCRVRAEVGHTIYDSHRGNINLKTNCTWRGIFLRHVI